MLGHKDVVALGGVDARADGRATQGELLQVRQRVAQGLQPKLQLRHVPPKFLTQGQRRGIHEVGATNLDDVVKGLRLRRQRVPQALHPGKGRFHDGGVGRDVHRRGEGVVGALALVHVVVGVNRTVALAEGAPCKDMGAVGHDLVDVHVALGARARLPNHQRKLVVELARQDFVAGRHNQVLLRRVHRPQLAVGHGCGTLQMGKRSDNLHGHRAHWTNLEVVARALGLGAPIFVSRHVDFAERVFFNAGGHGRVGFLRFRNGVSRGPRCPLRHRRPSKRP